MDDLVERARDADRNSVQRMNGSRIFGELADRIERQKADIRSLREQMAELEAELGYHGIYPNPIAPRDTKADSDGDDGA
jgi:hypothetical protein